MDTAFLAISFWLFFNIGKKKMNTQSVQVKKSDNGSLILGTGLVVASMILVPALATRLGLGASLTGALRIALMKASNRATSKA